MSFHETLTPRARELQQWLHAVIELVREEQDLNAIIALKERTADEYDGEYFDTIIELDRQNLKLCRKRLKWYRTRVMQMILDTDWSGKSSDVSRRMRDLAINRYYRGLPFSGTSTSMTCAHLAKVSKRRILQLNVEVLNRMEKVWTNEPCPY